MVQTYNSTEPFDASGVMGKYGQLKDEILRCIDSMMNDEYINCDVCSDLKEKIETNAFNLVVVGQFKRGKTLLINALLGADILPVAVIPLTSIVTILTFGDRLTITVHFDDGRSVVIDHGDLAAYVTEVGNPKNEKKVSTVVITYPSAYLKDGVRLIDTPGVGSVFQHNTDVAYQYLPQCDAALFLLSVDQPVSKAELDFLRDVRQYSGRIFFLLNKIDYVNEAECRESLTFSQQAISDVMGADVKIFPVSAKLALNGKLAGVEEALQKSNLPDFSRVLNEFLMNEKGKILLLSVANNALRALSQVRLELELELKSLTAPVEELEAKIEAFRAKKQEVVAERNDFEILLDGEFDRLLETDLDKDLNAFRASLTEQMEKKLTTFYEEHRHLSLKELNDAMEDFFTGEVRSAVDQWRVKKDEDLGAAFQAICDRFLLSINEKVEQLLQFSSQLFTVPFETVQTEPLWAVRSGSLYQFRNDPVALEMLGDSITQVLPKYISNRFQKIKTFLFRMANRRIIKKSGRNMVQMIDVQSGRMRYDFIERLTKSKNVFRLEMMKKIDATISGIENAIEKGIRQRSGGEGEIEARLSRLSGELMKMDGIRSELTSIRGQLSSFSA
jgi:GTP-binding protein EngB required for normal cell division